MIRILLPLVLVGALASALGGCAASGPLALAGTPGCSFVTAMRMAMAGLPCTPPKPPPAPYCTRSLGDADCWQDPGRLPGHPPQLADGGWEAPAPPPTEAPTPPSTATEGRKVPSAAPDQATGK